MSDPTATRILHVITALGIGGAEVMLRNVALHLDRARFSQRIVSLKDEGAIGRQIEAAGIPVTALHGRGGLLYPWQLLRLRRLVRQWRPHVLHTWMYHANVVGSWIRCGGEDRPRLITSVRGSLDASSAQKLSLRLMRRIDARLSRRADAVLFNSFVSASQHNDIGYDATKNLVIPNGFDVERFSPDSSRRARARNALGLGDDMVIGLVARFEPVKGHHLLLQAAGRFFAARTHARLVLVGRGCDASNVQLSNWISQYQLDGKVLLLGERSDVPDLLNAFDVVVCPSLSESFPNAIGEAMATSIPCVVTDVGDCAQLLGDTGAVARPRDPESLASCLARIADMPAPERSALGARARERIRTDFSIASIVTRYGEMYEQFL